MELSYQCCLVLLRSVQREADRSLQMSKKRSFGTSVDMMKSRGNLVVVVTRLRVGRTKILIPVDEIFAFKTPRPAVNPTGVLLRGYSGRR